jgi:hypothetical protein
MFVLGSIQADGYFHQGFHIFLIERRDQIRLSWRDRREATITQILVSQQNQENALEHLFVSGRNP